MKKLLLKNINYVNFSNQTNLQQKCTVKIYRNIFTERKLQKEIYRKKFTERNLQKEIYR